MNIRIAVVITVVGIMTMCLVVTKPLANHAFAAPASCSLSLKADPGSISIEKGGSIEQKITGKLSCDGTGLGGATIEFPPGSLGPDKEITFTDSSGNYHYSMLALPGKTYSIHANYDGDSNHSAAAAGRVIIIGEK